MTRFWILGLVMLGASLLVSGCASKQNPDEERVSTLPWNRPQNWEGSGALGGFRPPGSY